MRNNVKINGIMVKMVREQLGMSRTKLCKISGLSKPVIINIESNRNHDPKLSTLVALADALKLKPEELIHRVEPWKPTPTNPRPNS